MTVETARNTFPHLNEMIPVFFFDKHAHIAAGIASSRQTVKIDYELDIEFLRPLQRFFQIVKFFVEPSIIFREINLRADCAPITDQLSTYQIHVPLPERLQIFIFDGLGSHHAALAAMFRDSFRIFHFPVKINPIGDREKRTDPKRVKIKLYFAMTVLQSHNQSADSGGLRNEVPE
ncbi:hypothetical protein SDC9_174817 [bioreactor metagenome]|uniref:Uncharacterized protein n=1 Tax=bioreactor metagenome TaxID=1076179 RepID=A0A645GME7_9ZZZZ